MPQPIRTATIADLNEYGYSLSGYRWRCRRWHDLDLADWVEKGRGAADSTRLKFRCASCGAQSQKQVRPPGLVVL